MCRVVVARIIGTKIQANLPNGIAHVASPDDLIKGRLTDGRSLERARAPPPPPPSPPRRRRCKRELRLTTPAAEARSRPGNYGGSRGARSRRNIYCANRRPSPISPLFLPPYLAPNANCANIGVSRGTTICVFSTIVRTSSRFVSSLR